MKKDVVYNAIEKVLLEINGQSSLPENEIPYICALVSAICYSNEETRLFFYKGAHKIASAIEKRLHDERQRLKEIIEEDLLNETPKDKDPDKMN